MSTKAPRHMASVLIRYNLAPVPSSHFCNKATKCVNEKISLIKQEESSAYCLILKYCSFTLGIKKPPMDVSAGMLHAKISGHKIYNRGDSRSTCRTPHSKEFCP